RPAPGPPELRLRRLGPDPEVILAVDSMTWSCRAAILGLLGPLDPERVALLSPFGLDEATIGFPTVGAEEHGIGSAEDLGRAVPSAVTAVSAGAHGPAGNLGHDLMSASGGTSIVVQHGMLLP